MQRDYLVPILKKWRAAVHRPSILFSALSMLVSMAVFAGEHVAESHHINWWGLGSKYRDSPALGWYILTFIIFVSGLIYAVKKPLGLYLAARSNDIRKAINEAKIAKEDATKQMLACQQRLSQLDTEIAHMKAEFVKQGTLEKAQLKKAAEQMAIQIAKDADDVIAGDMRQAMYRLKQEMAGQVIALVREEIKNRTNQQIENHMRSEFTRDVGKLMH